MSNPRAQQIVDFWLADTTDDPTAAMARKELWYRCGPDFDREVVERFELDVEAACEDRLRGWERSATGALALVILLDQFTRNVYRNSPRAYRGDSLAIGVVNDAVRRGLDRELSVPGRIFLYHPFHHSEDVADQDRVLDLLEDLQAQASGEWFEYVGQSISGFGRHRDIVARFGRFPHRNAVLGRTSTAEEEAFLLASPNAFGQGPKTP